MHVMREIVSCGIYGCNPTLKTLFAAENIIVGMRKYFNKLLKL